MPHFIIKSYENALGIYDNHEILLADGGVVWRSNEYQNYDDAYLVANVLNYYHSIDELKLKLGAEHPHILFWEQGIHGDAWLLVYSSDIRYRVSDELRDIARKVCETLDR